MVTGVIWIIVYSCMVASWSVMPTIGSKKTNNVAFDTSAPVEQVTPGGRVLYSAGEGETVVKKKREGE